MKPWTDLFTAIVRTDLREECRKEYRFHETRRWRFDYALPRVRIAVEVEGGVWTRGRHVRGSGFLGDMEKYNTAAVMGWRVLRTTPDRLYSRATIEMLRQAIMSQRQE